MSIGLSLSDFISIPQFAWSVYQTCRDCTYEYHALGNEVASLHAVLSEVTDKLSDCELTIQSAERLAFLGKGCQDVLKKVEKTIASYNALKSTDVTLIARLRRGKKRIKWALEAPEKIRAQLLIQISLLNLFNSSLILSSVRMSHNETQQQYSTFAQHTARLDVSSKTDLNSTGELTLAQHGVIQACWGCKISATKCGPGNPCHSCILYEKRFCTLQCRRGPLASLARDIIPGFFHPNYCFKKLRNFKREGLEAQFLPFNSESATMVILEWEENMVMKLPIHPTLKDFEDCIDQNLLNLINCFQKDFPDQHGFRTGLVDIAIYFQKTVQHNVINLGFRFLILSFLIAHCVYVRGFTHIVSHSLQLEVKSCLSVILYKILQSLLEELETLLYARRRHDWPIICISLALVFLTAESLQVDIFIKTGDEKKFEEGCEAMQTNGIYVLKELFIAGTNGFNPLILDWEMDENKMLLGGDLEHIETVHNLQLLSQSYWSFLCDRKKTKFKREDTDCLTGKLTAHIF